MITRIEIDGFKTFRSFQMDFAPFMVIAGTNASGKSNVFDALRLISRIGETSLREAFSEQRGEAFEQFTLFSNGERANKISFCVELLVDSEVRDNWGGKESLKYTRLRYRLVVIRRLNNLGFEDLFIGHESLNPIRHRSDKWLKSYIPPDKFARWRPKVTGRRGIPYIDTIEDARQDKKSVKIYQDGRPGSGKEFPIDKMTQTALSAANSVELRHILAVREEMISWKFLQLNPAELRKPSPRMASDVVSSSGANLASTLFRMKNEDRSVLKYISRTLNALLPGFIEVEVDEQPEQNQYVIYLKDNDGRRFSSRVLSEGTLRLLSLCILKYDSRHKGALCYEEPENGVHAFRLAIVCELLKELTTNFTEDTSGSMPLRQVIVNTHSPIVIKETLNAKDSQVSVWFSRLITKIVEINGSKTDFKATSILPVVRDNKGLQGELFDYISTNQRELSAYEADKLLNSIDHEIESLSR